MFSGNIVQIIDFIPINNGHPFTFYLDLMIHFKAYTSLNTQLDLLLTLFIGKHLVYHVL